MVGSPRLKWINPVLFLKWNYEDPANGTDIFAERIGNSISITGQYKNEEYEDQLEVDNDPWYQDWGLGLQAFITSDNATTTFWSMSSNDLKKITKFEVYKEKIEKLQINGEKIETVYVKISLPGALKLFWSGDMWFRKSDGTSVISG